MAGLWQRTGNVTVTNGSKTVTGFGTKWKTGTLPIQKGHTFYGPDGVANEVDTVVSDTEILLVEAYRGGTMANQPYKIDTTRTSTISQFAADLAALVGKYCAWFDGMMTWLTGSGDVSILNPDTGANTTIPSWKKVASEGEGQAARAKAEADKAAASAALAGSIVEASALPLPDVWAPLSDSLRLITGYGRDVLVGSDVVARFLSFSRSTTKTFIGKDGFLKTAAINEPAFEKEGLLLEGQSTNLVPNSEDWLLSNHVAGGVSAKTASIVTPRGASATVKSAVANQDNVNFSAVGGVLTGMESAKSFSFFFKLVSANSGFYVYFSSQGSGWRVVIDSQGRVAAGSDPGAGAKVTPLQNGWFLLAGVLPASFDRFSFNLPRAGDELALWGLQLEALPFSSSYIPTTGAASSRAMDKSWLSVGGNLIPLSVIALEFNSIAPPSFYQSPNPTRYLVHFGDGTGITAFQGRYTCQFEDTGAAQGALIAMGRVSIAAGVSGGIARIKSGGATSTGVASKGFKTSEVYLGNANSGLADRQVFGHVRNFRIWHRDATESQFKAIS